MKQIPTLDAERVTLRPFSIRDAAAVQRLAGDRAIADMTLNIRHPYEDGMAEEWIAKHQDAFASDKSVALAVIRKADGDLVGAINLMSLAVGHQAELGYWIGKPYWNLGFCTEAGAVILQYAFSDLNLVRVHACHITRNPASGRVLQKLGMRHEGCRRQHAIKWGQCENLEMYGILRKEWEESAQRVSVSLLEA